MGLSRDLRRDRDRMHHRHCGAKRALRTSQSRCYGASAVVEPHPDSRAKPAYSSQSRIADHDWMKKLGARSVVDLVQLHSK